MYYCKLFNLFEVKELGEVYDTACIITHATFVVTCRSAVQLFSSGRTPLQVSCCLEASMLQRCFILYFKVVRPD